MKLDKLIENAKKAEPGLQKLPDGEARSLIARVFESIRAEIEGTKEGVVKVGALGRFRIKQVEREKDGKRTTITRVLFRPIKRHQ